MSTVLTVLKYDFRRFLRDWLMVAFSGVMIVLYVAVALFVPTEIAPKWDIAVTEAARAPIEALIKKDIEQSAEVALVTYATEAEMRKAFEEGAEHFVGIAFDEGAQAAVARGEKPRARVYVDESVPPDVQKTARAIGAMMAMAAFYPDTGPKEEPERLGPVIEATTFKQRTRALMAVMILIMEMLALASLLSREITSGVVHAILTTTVSLPRYFVAKLVFGTTLAFVQAGVLAAAVGAMAPDPVAVALLLLLGAVMFTAMGIIAGTRGRHLMEVIMWAMLFMLPCIVPAFAVMLPGTAPLIVQVLPSYPLIQGVLTAGQAEPLLSSWTYIGWSAAWTVALCGAAYAALRWRVK
jgi:hypothetical protein